MMWYAGSRLERLFVRISVTSMNCINSPTRRGRRTVRVSLPQSVIQRRLVSAGRRSRLGSTETDGCLGRTSDKNDPRPVPSDANPTTTATPYKSWTSSWPGAASVAQRVAPIGVIANYGSTDPSLRRALAAAGNFSRGPKFFSNPGNSAARGRSSSSGGHFCNSNSLSSLASPGLPPSRSRRRLRALRRRQTRQ
jgi:hypothetical protein